MAESGGPGRRPARRRALAIGLGIATALVFAALVGWPDRLAPTDPSDQVTTARLRPPGVTVGATRYILGSDHLGRDV